MNDCLDMKTALAQLKQDGMEKVYFSYDTLKNDTDEKIMEMLQELELELELEVEGLYGFFRFDRFPMDDSYQGMIDMAVKVNAKNVLIVPGFISEDDKQEEKQLSCQSLSGRDMTAVLSLKCMGIRQKTCMMESGNP